MSKEDDQFKSNSELASVIIDNNDNQFWKILKCINENTKKFVSLIRHMCDPHAENLFFV